MTKDRSFGKFKKESNLKEEVTPKKNTFYKCCSCSNPISGDLLSNCVCGSNEFYSISDLEFFKLCTKRIENEQGE